MKKIFILAFTVLLVLSLSTISVAEELSTNTQSLEFNFKYYYLNYKEVDTDGSFFDSETGWQNGLNLIYKIQIPNTKLYGQISYESTNHTTDYDGFYLGTGIPVKSTTSNLITNYEALFAIPFGMENGYIAAGIGFRRWNRDLQATQKEDYSWYYIPIGYRWEYSLNDKWDGAIDVTAMIMFNGQMTAYNPPYDSFQVNLGNKPGFKIDLPFTYKFNSNWAMTIKPWYEYSSIGISNSTYQTYHGIPAYIVWEPDSSTNQYGIDFGVKYNF